MHVSFQRVNNVMCNAFATACLVNKVRMLLCLSCQFCLFVKSALDVTFVELPPPPLPVTQPPRGYQYGPHHGSLPPNQTPGIMYNHNTMPRSDYRDQTPWQVDHNSYYNQGEAPALCVLLIVWQCLWMYDLSLNEIFVVKIGSKQLIVTHSHLKKKKKKQFCFVCAL